jgi:hypothetical protein
MDWGLAEIHLDDFPRGIHRMKTAAARTPLRVEGQADFIALR